MPSTFHWNQLRPRPTNEYRRLRSDWNLADLCDLALTQTIDSLGFGTMLVLTLSFSQLNRPEGW